MITSKLEKQKLKTKALELFEDYEPLKGEIDDTRAAIGLSELPGLTEIQHFLK